MGKPECSTVLHNRWGVIQHGVQQRSNDVLHQLVTMKQGVNVWPQSGFRNGSFFHDEHVCPAINHVCLHQIPSH